MLPIINLFILIYCSPLQIFQIVAVYGGAQLAHCHFFHFMQLEYMAQHTSEDHVFLILWFRHIHQLSAPLMKNSLHHPPVPNVPASLLSANLTLQVFLPYLLPKKRHMPSKH
jgi:hypothetical protein